MDNFSGSNGFPVRNSVSSGGGGFNRASNFNELSGSGGERLGGGAPPPMQPYANGMLSRSAATLPREDSLQSVSGSGGGSRSQQPSHEVFMVREAGGGSRAVDRESAHPPGKNSSSGSRAYGEGSDPPGERERPSHFSSHHSSHHPRERDKEKELSSTTKLVPTSLPKMLKIAVVGNSTAGKSAICNAFTSEGYNFSRNYHMTTGVSVFAKSVKLPGKGMSSETATSDDSLVEPRINLVLVDSAGKDIYREMLPQYWDRLDGLALVIDLTSSTALETALEWLNLANGCISSAISSQLKHHPSEDGSGDQSNRRGGDSYPPSFLGVLIGTKNDLKEQRVINPKAAQDFAAQHGLQYFECSAKENSGIEEPFFYLAHQWTSTIGAGGRDKENLSFEGSTGGIFGVGKSTGGTTSSSSRRSAFASRHNSSEGFE